MWMLRAAVWMLRAALWMLRAAMWMLRAAVWMLRAAMWMLRAVLRMLRAAMWMLRAAMWMLRAVLRMLRAVMWMLRAAMWMLRAVLWTLRAHLEHVVHGAELLEHELGALGDERQVSLEDALAAALLHHRLRRRQGLLRVRHRLRQRVDVRHLDQSKADPNPIVRSYRRKERLLLKGRFLKGRCKLIIKLQDLL
eukprot:1249053-Pyramimonas_sp.AAC.1